MFERRTMRTSLLAVLAISFVFAVSGSAMAQDSPTQDAYGGVLGNEVETTNSNTEATTEAATTEGTEAATAQVGGDELPFTGLELGLVALAGIGLVALGFAMRRTTRRPPTA
jgi:hypothetical protein